MSTPAMAEIAKTLNARAAAYQTGNLVSFGERR